MRVGLEHLDCRPAGANVHIAAANRECADADLLEDCIGAFNDEPDIIVIQWFESATRKNFDLGWR